MKNMLVTGGCGFIGTNFIKYLLEESGFKGRVVNVDALTYAGNPLNLTEIEQRFTEHYAFIQTDICNKVDMSRIF
ncbi:MAG: GDP-mannose 4,6-dehydratase, partial [Deltaproteobacteria bacterium]|nr:GDP-mannose 4,6-dehydratase [Deltaproteobacteria bacterium]